jgi:hypothetical protein
MMGKSKLLLWKGARVCVPQAQRNAPLPFGKGVWRLPAPHDGDPPSLQKVPSFSIPRFQHSSIPRESAYAQ